MGLLSATGLFEQFKGKSDVSEGDWLQDACLCQGSIMHHKFQKGISSGEVWAGADHYAFREEQCVGEGVRNNSQFQKASCSTSFTGAGTYVKSACGRLGLEI